MVHAILIIFFILFLDIRFKKGHYWFRGGRCVEFVWRHRSGVFHRSTPRVRHWHHRVFPCFFKQFGQSHARAGRGMARGVQRCAFVFRGLLLFQLCGGNCVGLVAAPHQHLFRSGAAVGEPPKCAFDRESRGGAVRKHA